MNRQPIRVQMTGHEEPSYIIEIATTAVGPPLARFVEGAMVALERRGRTSTVARWREHRRNQVNTLRERDREFSREDARVLVGDVGAHWTDLRSCLPNGSDVPPDVLANLGGRLRAIKPAIDGTKHNRPLTLDAAKQVLETLETLMRAIGATDDANYLKVPLVALKNAQRQASRGLNRPNACPPARADTVCLGLHWVEPRDTVPGSWWRVEIDDGTVTQCDVELTSDEIVEVVTAPHAQPLLAGLAFCFSAPAWYIADWHDGQPERFWERCETFSNREIGPHLEGLGPPFERTQRRRHPTKEPTYFRDTERQALRRGAIPASIFQVGGEGSVGALALNGIPLLPRLRAKGVAIWPFDDPRPDQRTCVEIFPRALWAALNPSEDPRSKKNENRRRAFIAACEAAGTRIQRAKDRSRLAKDERAFDAFLTAWALSQHGGGLTAVAPDGPERLEGRIWWPEQ